MGTEPAVRVRRIVVHSPEGTVEATVPGSGCTMTCNAPAILTLAQAFDFARQFVGGNVPDSWLQP